MKSTDFAKLLADYLSQYLPGQRNVSTNTIISYRDTFKLFLIFSRDKKGVLPEHLVLAHIDEGFVNDFLLWIENERKCGISTRNQRLAAIHAFFRYVQVEAPEMLLRCQRILSIPFKKNGRAAIDYLSPDALKILLEQPDKTASDGRRDLVLMTVLYDTGARVQELIDLVVRDIRLDTPPIVALTGKGKKTRHVPLMSKTAKMLSAYLAERHLDTAAMSNHQVFYNRQRNKLTRAGVLYIISKYVKAARTVGCTLFPEKVTPHSLRHSKAMHLLQANVNLVYIRDLLGHVNVSTTEIYARADSETKRLALEKAYIEVVADDIPTWSDDKDLLSWLQNFCSSQTVM
jgi:site-specific recombinase XerD